MVKIVVFDSGLGSLSIIKAIQKSTKSEIIYFADKKNFPYGKKSKSELHKIINNTIKNLKKTFHPDFIIVGSNTPSLMLDLETRKIIGVKPPLSTAIKISKTNNIAILATNSAIKSRGLSNYINEYSLPKKIKIKKINASKLVELVESGKFLTKKTFCKKIIKKELKKQFTENDIDVCTLSSTHLPFLMKLLKEEFPQINFIDPANIIAQKIAEKIIPNKKNSLKIFSSEKTREFEKNLRLLGIRNKITLLSF